MQQATQSEYLTILTHAPADAVKQLAEQVIPRLGDIVVLRNRTGLVMLPYNDSAEGAVFHLGEMLIAEAHVRVASAQGSGGEGYGAVVGRDLEQAMAVALLDAALNVGIMSDEIARFVAAQYERQRQEDETLLRHVQATRVEMETF